MKHFFISYNKADRRWAEWMAWQLEEAGYTTVVQAWDFRPGGNFVLDMQQAATDAERTIAVLSPDFLAAPFTQPEWAAAFAQDPTGEKGLLLPVRVRECKLEGLLPQIVYVDLVGLDEAAAQDALLSGVKRERAKPATAPAFPVTVPRSVSERPRFPGALPPVWNLLHQRNPNFTGRAELLSQLRDALTAGRATALTQAIHGLGGVGKTQLAVEYAYRHAAEYEVVWWVRAEEPAALAADYANLAEALGLPEKHAPDQSVIVAVVKQWLQQNKGWLLIFDNANEPADVRPYLPQGGAGHVLVTSRNPTWRGVASPLSVRVMEESEAVEFLLKRSGQTDEAAAKSLAKALGYLPLALEQAAAYVEETGQSLSHYLQLFQTRQRELMQRGAPPTDYPHTVATTWDISFQAVTSESAAGADLLNLCAFLAPDDIPRDLLCQGHSERSEESRRSETLRSAQGDRQAAFLPAPLSAAVADPLAFDDACAALRRYSLMEVSGGVLSVHRLVQAVARDRLTEDDRKTWAAAAARIMTDAFPFQSDDVRTWHICSRLLTHALAAAGHAEELQVAAEETGRLLNQAGLYLGGRAQFAEAKAAYERALRIAEVAFGENHPNVASIVNNLGEVLRQMGDLAGARAHYERALRTDEAANHPNVARDVNNLGSVLRQMGDLAGARAHYERALRIDEAAFGENHPNVARDVNNLGLVVFSKSPVAVLHLVNLAPSG